MSVALVESGLSMNTGIIGGLFPYQKVWKEVNHISCVRPTLKAGIIIFPRESASFTTAAS